MDAVLNLVVIRSSDIDRAIAFYTALGVPLQQEQHGGGPVHFAAEIGGTVLEIYPRRNDNDSTSAIRLGFLVDSVEQAAAAAQTAGGRLVSAPRASEWGLRAVVEDPDGHRIELTAKAIQLSHSP